MKSLIINKKIRLLTIFITFITIFACEDFLEIPSPTNQITGQIVFEDEETAEAALIHIYTQLRDNTLVTGGISGLPYLLGLYGDELTLTKTNEASQYFFDNNLTASNTSISNIWKNTYNLIYAINNLIDGIDKSNKLSQIEKSGLLGEAYFIRAFMHFYLVNAYGAIPYITTPDYRINSKISKSNVEDVYNLIIDDLKYAKLLLPENYHQSNRSRPNKFTISALLARTYLYNSDWVNALDEASQIIDAPDYILSSNIDSVFINTSKETIWHFDTGIPGFNTYDAQTYIFESGPPPNCMLSYSFVDHFEDQDLRKTNWIGTVTDGSSTWYFANKYKLNTTTGSTQECSIVFRMAEIYLIAAEANTQLNNIEQGLAQLNKIRERVNLQAVTLTNKGDILLSIYNERRAEFFCEMAHRFFDLKRTSLLDSTLGDIKPNWNSSNTYFPLPETELILNPNLEPQNEGY